MALKRVIALVTVLLIAATVLSMGQTKPGEVPDAVVIVQSGAGPLDKVAFTYSDQQ